MGPPEVIAPRQDALAAAAPAPHLALSEERAYTQAPPQGARRLMRERHREAHARVRARFPRRPCACRPPPVLPPRLALQKTARRPVPLAAATALQPGMEDSISM